MDDFIYGPAIVFVAPVGTEPPEGPGDPGDEWELLHPRTPDAIPDGMVALAAQPCELCAREAPCLCGGRERCACTCGRCLYPFPLDDDGPNAPGRRA